MDEHAVRPIVVGVDPSDSAREAAGWAAELAAAMHAPLHMLHSVPAGEPVPAQTPAWLRDTADRARRRAGVAPSVEVVSGGTIDLLAERASAARMLVLGSYGEGAWSGMLAGAVALALAGRVPCPVAVVRGTAPQEPPPRDGPVVAGVDGSPTAHEALLLAAEIATSLSAPLVALHAWSEIVTDAGAVRRRHEDWSELAERGADLLAAEARAVSQLPDAPVVRTELVQDTSLRALLQTANDARVLVVGHRGERPLPALGLGSTSRALVEFAPCPVVVTPPVPEPSAPASTATMEGSI